MYCSQGKFDDAAKEMKLGACRSSGQPEELCGWLGEATRGETGYKPVGPRTYPWKLTGVAPLLVLGDLCKGRVQATSHFSGDMFCLSEKRTE